VGSVFLQWIFDPYLKPKMDTDNLCFLNRRWTQMGNSKEQSAMRDQD